MAAAAGRERIEGFDVARALAILGMVLVHFGLILAREGWRDSRLAGLLDLLDGRAAATFLVLAGLGIAVRTKKAEDLATVRRSIFRRGLYLLGAGWLLLLVWPGDILRVYGVTMLVAAGTQSLEVALLTGAGFFFAAAAGSLAYKRWFSHGPLEWMMRAITDTRNA